MSSWLDRAPKGAPTMTVEYLLARERAADMVVVGVTDQQQIQRADAQRAHPACHQFRRRESGRKRIVPVPEGGKVKEQRARNMPRGIIGRRVAAMFGQETACIENADIGCGVQCIGKPAGRDQRFHSNPLPCASGALASGRSAP